MSAANVIDASDVTAKQYSCEVNEVAAVTHRLWLFVAGPIILLGLFLNGLNIAILRGTKSQSNAFYMLQCLAVSDILYLTVCLLYFPVRHLYVLLVHGDDVYKRRDWHMGTELLFAVDPLYTVFLMTRNWTVVIVTMERLLNIVSPLWARKAITRLRLNIVIGFIYVVAFSYVVERYFTRKLVLGVNECTGEAARFIRSPPGRTLIFKTIYVGVIVVVPQCIIYVSNIVLIVSLRRSARERAKMAGTEQATAIKSQRQAVVIVLAMSMVFTVCETPACIDRFINLGGINFNTDLTRMMRRSALLLNILDSSVNFFAYCGSSRVFRRSLAQLIRKRSAHNTDQTVSVSVSSGQAKDGGPRG